MYHLKLFVVVEASLSAIVLVSGCADRGGAEMSEAYPFQEKVLQYVLQDSIPRDGGFNYYWPQGEGVKSPNDSLHLGTAKNISYLGTPLSIVREEKGTHCVGISWQVAMSVMQEWSRSQESDGAINNMTVEDIKDFTRQWFVSLGGAPLEAPGEMGAVNALVSFGLGERVSFEDARPGDFVQFWRMDGSGHSSIFLHWVYEADGNISGYHYWGSQPQTDGIGTDTEYFYPNDLALDEDRLLDRKRFYIGRLAPE